MEWKPPQLLYANDAIMLVELEDNLDRMVGHVVGGCKDVERCEEEQVSCI